jgi:hypothetical protein
MSSAAQEYKRKKLKLSPNGNLILRLTMAQRPSNFCLASLKIEKGDGYILTMKR